MADPWENVKEYLCQRFFQFVIMFAMGALGLVLNTVSTQFVEPGSMTSVVIQINYVGLIALTLFSGGVLMMCRREL